MSLQKDELRFLSTDDLGHRPGRPASAIAQRRMFRPQMTQMNTDVLSSSVFICVICGQLFSFLTIRGSAVANEYPQRCLPQPRKMKNLSTDDTDERNIKPPCYAEATALVITPAAGCTSARAVHRIPYRLEFISFLHLCHLCHLWTTLLFPYNPWISSG